MVNNFDVVELVSLKLLNFRFIITYFGTLKMRQIAPFFIIFFRGSMPLDPLALVRIHILSGLPTRLLCNSLSLSLSG